MSSKSLISTIQIQLLYDLVKVLKLFLKWKNGTKVQLAKKAFKKKKIEITFNLEKLFCAKQIYFARCFKVKFK